MQCTADEYSDARYRFGVGDPFSEHHTYVLLEAEGLSPEVVRLDARDGSCEVVIEGLSDRRASQLELAIQQRWSDPL